jgi:hypothetical protein
VGTGAAAANNASPQFFWQLMPYMEGNTIFNAAVLNTNAQAPFKPFIAPLDPAATNQNPGLSYGVNTLIAISSTAVAVMPGTFNQRGTSNTVLVAERTCMVSGSAPVAPGARYYTSSDVGFNGAAVPALALPLTAASNNGVATAFSSSGVQVVMCDGSVRSVNSTQTGSGDWTVACTTNSTIPLTSAW